MTELFSCNLRDDVTIEAIEEALMNEEKGKGRALSFSIRKPETASCCRIILAMTFIICWTQ